MYVNEFQSLILFLVLLLIFLVFLYLRYKCFRTVFTYKNIFSKVRILQSNFHSVAVAHSALAAYSATSLSLLVFKMSLSAL